MKVQNKLKELLFAKMQREQRIITPIDVARACGMTRQNVHRWINNEVKTYPGDTIYALCVYIPCAVGDLLVMVGQGQLEAEK